MNEYQFKKTLFLIDKSKLEDSALKQFEIIDAKPYVIKSVAMPDAHSGKSEMPVGGVALTDGVIAPEWVGVDIGCGVCYLNTGIKYEDFMEKITFTISLEEFYLIVKNRIPMGFHKHNTGKIGTFTSALNDNTLNMKIRSNEIDQLGTLGGGNHFIEFGINDQGYVCIVLHTGSRNLGLTICNYYLNLGTHFKFDSELGQAYYQDMTFAVNWALNNRYKIIQELIEVLEIFNFKLNIDKNFDIINIHHNYAEITNEGILHRKGATSAKYNELGIIPGNMKDGTVIIKGLGNDTYLNSCSHGAGRALSRSQAVKTLDFDKFKQEMKDANILISINESILDEAPGAYKDFNEIISLQKDILFEVINTVKPFMVFKDDTVHEAWFNKKKKKHA